MPEMARRHGARHPCEERVGEDGQHGCRDRPRKDETHVGEAQASAAVSFTLLYHRLPADLSATNLTNFLTGRYRTLLKAACLVRAYQWLKNADGIADAKQDREAAFQTAEAMDDIDMNTQFDPREFDYVE